MTPISCEECRAQLAALPLEALPLNVNDLSRENLPPALASHLKTCAACQIEYSMLRGIVGEMRAFPQFAAPPDLRQKIRAQIAAEDAQKAARSFGSRFKMPSFPTFKVPRWAIYSLPATLGAACLLFLVMRDPSTNFAPSSADFSTESRNPSAQIQPEPQRENVAKSSARARILAKNAAPNATVKQDSKSKQNASTKPNSSVKTPSSSTRSAPDSASAPINRETAPPENFDSSSENLARTENAPQNIAPANSKSNSAKFDASDSAQKNAPDANSVKANSGILKNEVAENKNAPAEIANQKRQLFARLEILPDANAALPADLARSTKNTVLAPVSPALKSMETHENEYSMRRSSGGAEPNSAPDNSRLSARAVPNDSAQSSVDSAAPTSNTASESADSQSFSASSARSAARPKQSRRAAPTIDDSTSQNAESSAPNSDAPAAISQAPIEPAAPSNADVSRSAAPKIESNAKNSAQKPSDKTDFGELMRRKNNSAILDLQRQFQRARLTIVPQNDAKNARILVVGALANTVKTSSQTVWSGDAQRGKPISIVLNLPIGNKNRSFQVLLQSANSRGAWRTLATKTLRPSPAKS